MRNHSYPIVVLFTILRHHTCISIELVTHDVIVPVSNYCMIKSSLRDIGLHDVEPNHNSRTIRITVRKNFKVMTCGVYKIPCTFITVYIAPRFQKCAHLHTITWKLQLFTYYLIWKISHRRICLRLFSIPPIHCNFLSAVYMVFDLSCKSGKYNFDTNIKFSTVSKYKV